MKKNLFGGVFGRKAIIWLSVLFLISVVGDMISTARLGNLVPLLEANPIYKYIGLWGIALLNVLLLVYLFWSYDRNKSSINSRFITIHVLLTSIFIRIFVIINNWNVGTNPPTVEVAQQITVAMKQQAMVSFLAPVVLPFFLGIVSFYIFRLDHSVVKKVSQ